MITKNGWESTTLAASLSKAPERASKFATSSGIELARLYLPDALTPESVARVGFPGEHPFTRGVQPTMYRARLWTIRQYAGYATAEESNARYRFLLSQGQSGLSVAFDLPTQIGYDADDPIAHGEVGKVGVSICTLDDMARLFEGIPLDQVSTSMTINAPASILLALYIAVQGDGVLVKLAGEVTTNAQGQLVTTFENNPQLPFSSFDLTFFGGPRGALMTPESCGTFTSTATLTPRRLRR